jgi:murein DD-endopeptidase MepM/ murein hydrolase activator NlpD
MKESVAQLFRLAAIFLEHVWYRLLGLGLVWLVFGSVAEAMTYSSATYSDIVVSGGIIYGWGVTDASSGCYCHKAKVTTTITSPNGRIQTNGDLYGGRGHEVARADVQLPFDETDVGDYTEFSTHWAFCPYCNCNFINGSQSSFTMLVSTPIQHNYPRNPLPQPCWISSFFDAVRNGHAHHAEDVVYDNGQGTGGTPPPYGAPVYAMEAGTAHPVVGTEGPASKPYPQCLGAPGNYIKIKSDSDGYFTIYFHVKPSISDNQHVDQGQVIGVLDNSGCQTKPHLHVSRKTPSGVPVNFTIPCVNPTPSKYFDDGLVGCDVPDDI